MTIYFINEGLGKSNSGIEHAEFDRARLFRRNHIPFKLVTSSYIQKLHSILPMFALSDDESINMFDYFQKALHIKSKIITPQDVDFGMDVEAEKVSKTLYHVKFNEHFLGRIVVDIHNHVERVEYFDVFGNLYQVINYDSRGFKSLQQWYSPDNKVELEIWYDVSGKAVIEKVYGVNRANEQYSTWKVDGMIFDNIQDLRLYFYNCLNQNDKNMFIIDRANVSEWQLPQLDKPAYLVFMLHNHQSSDAQNPNAALLNDNYEWSLAHIRDWDAIVSATPQQTHDIETRWGKDLNTFTIPVGIIPDGKFLTPRIPMSDRKPHSMLVTARIASEKGIDKMIQALAIARKTIPDLTLDVYGYVDHSNQDLAMTNIKNAIKELDDEKAVVLHDHTTDVASLHEQYQVYLIFSQMEGFNLALMEAQSAGMVGLTNDVSYGPNELIKDGQNGYIVDYNDIQVYAKKMVDLFTNPDTLQAFSDKAYDLSNRYSDDSVMAKWKPVFDDFKKF